LGLARQLEPSWRRRRAGCDVFLILSTAFEDLKRL
jgi:hypothetical protein